jgi:exopolyphosphatase/pppGpp-phosphohydrolase
LQALYVPEREIHQVLRHNENGTKETKQWLKEGQAAKRQERTSRIDEKLEQALLARLAG